MKKKTLAIVLISLALAAMAALAGCSQPAQSTASSSASDEALSVMEGSASAQISDEPFYVLIIGNDTRLGTVDINKDMYADGKARSDTMMLARVDPKTYQITLVSIPRDTQDWIGGEVGKINEHYREGGAEELIDAIEKLTGVRAKYYLDTTFVGFQDLINTLGGIYVWVPIDQKMKDIVSGETIEFPAGEQTLDGAQALVYARERKNYNPNGEVYRQANDRHIVEVMIQKVLSDPDTAVEMSGKLFDIVDSNWDKDEFLAYASDFAAHADEVHFLGGTGPYEGDDDPESGLWLTWRDEATWHEIMDVVNQGGDPNEVFQGLSMYE